MQILTDEGEIAAVTEQTLYITYGCYQVAVSSTLPDVLFGLECMFRQMIAPSPKQVVKRIAVCRTGAKYQMLGIDKFLIEERSLRDILRCLNYEITLQLVKAHSNLLWIHAAAAAYEDSAVLIAGPSGRGKSTLVTHLVSQGWKYLSDDILPVDMNSQLVHPFPRTPAVRKNLGRELKPECLLQLRKHEIPLGLEQLCWRAVPLRMLIFPVYNLQRPTTMSYLSPANAAMELLQNCLNFINHREVAVQRLCDLAQCLPSFRLSYRDCNVATKLVVERCGGLYSELLGNSDNGDKFVREDSLTTH